MTLLIIKERGRIYTHVKVRLPNSYLGKQFKLTWDNVEYRTDFRVGFVLIELTRYIGEKTIDADLNNCDPLHFN